jgi:hypothetical protein
VVQGLFSSDRLRVMSSVYWELTCDRLRLYLSRNNTLKRDYEQIRGVAGPHNHSTALESVPTCNHHIVDSEEHTLYSFTQAVVA